MDNKVSVFLCGAQKGGTTSLHAYLSDHPALSPPDRKELHVFDDECLDWRAPDYAALHGRFSPHDEGRLRFESTPIYIFWPSSIERIARYNPDAKLIFLFRDPFERAWSHWCMEYARGAETLPFAQAIREGRRRLEGVSPVADAWRVYSYVERGFYGAQVKRALEHFPPGQCLFLRSEDLRNDHRSVLDLIASFLGIGTFPSIPAKCDNARADHSFPSAPTPSDRLLISELMCEDIERFAALTGLDTAGWSVSLRLTEA